MAKYLHEFPKNLTEYPNSFKRQGAFPLEMYSVFTSLDAAKAYAEDPDSVAYVGQPIAVTEAEHRYIFREGMAPAAGVEHVYSTYGSKESSFILYDDGIVDTYANETFLIDGKYTLENWDPLNPPEVLIAHITGISKEVYENPNQYEINATVSMNRYDDFNEYEIHKNEYLDYIGGANSINNYTYSSVVNYTVKYYIIGNTEGRLIELGTAENAEDLNARLSEVEKFFEATDNLNQTIDTLYELQEFIKEHGQDFSALHKDVKDIYTPAIPADPVTGTPEIPEDGYLVDKEKQLRREIENIYKAGVGQEPPTGELPDETRRRIEADEALGKRIDAIYDADGGLAEDGITKIPSGLLVEETNNRVAADAAEAKAREDADAKIYDDLLGSDPRKEDTEFNGVSGILAGIRGNKVDGKYQYNNIIEYIQNEIPIATENRLGRVLSSKEKDQVAVDKYGRMTVNSLNVNKLYQTEYLIIDGGTATPVAFTPKEEEPTIEEV